MVKGYDPSKNDPSKLILQYLMRWTVSQNPLSLEQAQKYTKYWLKQSQSTSNIYKLFNTINMNNNNNNFSKISVNNENNQAHQNSPSRILPQIILKKSCSNILKNLSFGLILKSNNLIDENFPAYTEDNRIYVCLNYITNKTELKENIDRELMILYRKNEQRYGNTIKNNRIKNKKNGLNEVNSKNNIKQTKQDNYVRELQQKDKQLCSYIYQGCKQGYKNYMLEPELQERLSKKCTKYLFFRRTPRNLPYDVKFRYASKILQEVV